MIWLTSHIQILLPCLILITCLAFCSRYLNERVMTWILRGLIITLFICEIAKQINALDNYQDMYLPFHYSSSYYVCIALFAFGKGRAKHFGMVALYVGGFLLLGTLLVNPKQVIGNPKPSLLFSDFYNFYSLFYHLAILYTWLVLLFRRSYRARPLDLARYAVFLGGWSMLAAPAAFHTGFNYAGILVSYIPFLEALRQQAGQACYLIVYAVGAVIASGLLLGMHHLLTLLFDWLKERLALLFDQMKKRAEAS